MSPEEFAELHALTLEEARVILARRAARSIQGDITNRLARAQAALESAQKKVGVHPVEEGYADELVRRDDPEADENLKRFYQTKGGSLKTSDDMRWDWVAPEEGGFDE